MNYLVISFKKNNDRNIKIFKCGSIDEYSSLQSELLDYKIYSVYDIESPALLEQIIENFKSTFNSYINPDGSFNIPAQDACAFFDSISKIHSEVSTHKNQKRIYMGGVDENTIKNYLQALYPKQRKNLFKEALTRLGYRINDFYTLASLNSNDKYYWSNPPVKYLNEDWSLVMDDTKRMKLYIFEIKAHSIHESDIKCRKDQRRNDCMSLEFLYDNPHFLDSESGIEFEKYKIGEISYKELGKEYTENVELVKISLSIDDKNLMDYATNGKIKGLSFKGNKYSIDDNNDLFQIIFGYLNDVNPQLFRKCAHIEDFENYFRFYQPGENEEPLYTRVGSSNIYYKNEIADKQLDDGLKIVKKMMSKSKFNIPYNELIINCEIYGKSRMSKSKQPSRSRDTKIKTGRKNKERFSFYKCGIRPGSIVTFIKNTSEKATVINETEVEYGGKAYTLTALTKVLLHDSKPVQGPRYWKYNNVLLTELRKEKEDHGEYK